MGRVWIMVGIVANLVFAAAAVHAQSPLDTEVAPEAEIVNYPMRFFQQYEPDTALDMVRLLPGFQLDNGGSKRGFGGAAGNILINDRRPSTKQDSPSDILRRLPAAIVERIELIRGQVPGLNLEGQSVVANLILREDAPAAYRWDASIRKHSNVTPLRPEGSISVSTSLRDIEYTAGLSSFRATFGDEGSEYVFDGDGGLVEERQDDASVVNYTTKVYLNATSWIGETLMGVNTSLSYVDRSELFESQRIPQDGTGLQREELFGDYMDTASYELGIDLERALSQTVSGRGILLLSGSSRNLQNDQRVTSADGQQSLFRVATSGTGTQEAISRLEFEWAGWETHTLKANLEVAYNELDNELLRTDDTGAGPIIVDVPGANTKVTETRYDALVFDTWIGERWSLDYGLGAESSTISQSGDANLERSFFFLKPRVLFTLSLVENRQIRASLVREVAQLNFNDFVSATVFLDDDLALGNPNLKPESTWVSELTYERRFGELGVLSVTAFYNRITDVQDLLPLTDEFEAPGNIGDGKRWGVEAQSTMPLDKIGLVDARLDLQLRLQDSSVTDPVTLSSRVLTAGGGFSGIPTSLPFRQENDYAYSLGFRQDVLSRQFAWGWSISKRSERPRFKVNELDIFEEKDPIVDAFIETTRWLGVKLRFEINNLLDLSAKRDRRIYEGRRGLSSVARRELQDYSLGRRFIVSASGSF